MLLLNACGAVHSAMCTCVLFDQVLMLRRRLDFAVSALQYSLLDAYDPPSQQHGATKGTTSSTSMVAQFHADKKARLAHELDLRQKEIACMQLVREQRRESIKASTRATYDRYQAIFSVGCRLDQVDDNDRRCFYLIIF